MPFLRVSMRKAILRAFVPLSTKWFAMVFLRKLTITDRAYLLFEGKILFQGKPEELAENKIVREKYLSNSFVLRKKDFQLIDEQKRAKEAATDG